MFAEGFVQSRFAQWDKGLYVIGNIINLREAVIQIGYEDGADAHFFAV